jgi:alkylhydroperoxidase family enzyme
MIRSSRREGRTKAMAEVLAMLATAQPFDPHRAHPASGAEESLFESATEFCAALELYAARATQMTKFKY